MYCPNCASEVKQDLQYCNSCGYRIGVDKTGDAGNVSSSLSKAIGWIGVVGLVSFVFVIKLLLESEILGGLMVAIAFFYLAALFGICYSVLDFIKSTLGGTQSKQKTAHQPPMEISGRNTNQLEPAHTQPASVIENTTRTLDKVPIENK